MSSESLPSQTGPVYHILSFYYIHVLDQNTGVTRLEIGPKTFFKQDNETITLGPEKMIILPPRHYCVVENPVVKNDIGQVQLDENGQIPTNSVLKLEALLDFDDNGKQRQARDEGLSNGSGKQPHVQLYPINLLLRIMGIVL
ncbi:unnamed protein product [Rotaria sp. Silwood2]|nr:unnamed protein product [Rotaria sp. Silwood2]